MQFKVQKNDNLELLFKHGNVQFIKVLMSAQYYAKENLAVIVVRIHSDTYNQFKELIKTLREAYKKVDGEWVLRAKPAAFVADAIVYGEPDEGKSATNIDQLLKEAEQEIKTNDNSES